MKFLAPLLLLLSVTAVCADKPDNKAKNAKAVKTAYYAYSYQWTVFIGNGNVVAGPTCFGVVKTPDIEQDHIVRMMSKNLKQEKKDSPKVIIPALFSSFTVPIFSKLTPIDKEKFELARDAKITTLEILED